MLKDKNKDKEKLKGDSNLQNDEQLEAQSALEKEEIKSPEIEEDKSAEGPEEDQSDVDKLMAEVAKLTEERKVFSDKCAFLAYQIYNLEKQAEDLKRSHEKELETKSHLIIKRFALMLIGIKDSAEELINIDEDFKDEKIEQLKSFNLGLYGSFTRMKTVGALSLAQIRNALQSFNISEIEPSKTFDPNVHIAIVAKKSPNHENNEIIEVIQKGYRINDKILRYSSVVVCSNSE